VDHPSQAAPAEPIAPSPSLAPVGPPRAPDITHRRDPIVPRHEEAPSPSLPSRPDSTSSLIEAAARETHHEYGAFPSPEAARPVRVSELLANWTRLAYPPVDLADAIERQSAEVRERIRDRERGLRDEFRRWQEGRISVLEGDPRELSAMATGLTNELRRYLGELRSSVPDAPLGDHVADFVSPVLMGLAAEVREVERNDPRLVAGIWRLDALGAYAHHLSVDAAAKERRPVEWARGALAGHEPSPGADKSRRDARRELDKALSELAKAYGKLPADEKGKGKGKGRAGDLGRVAEALDRVQNALEQTRKSDALDVDTQRELASRVAAIAQLFATRFRRQYLSS